MKYQGFFKPKNPQKYLGNTKNIVYRSFWEFSVFRWCDNHPSVKEWGSEEIQIPYFCPTDNSVHNYYIDLMIKFVNGKKYLIEIKPKRETIPPTMTENKSKRTYNKEVLTFVKNQAKWEAAKAFAEGNNMKFNIWTEETLKSLGIRVK